MAEDEVSRENIPSNNILLLCFSFDRQLCSDERRPKDVRVYQTTEKHS